MGWQKSLDTVQQQICYSVSPEFPPGSFSWLGGMKMPFEVTEPVRFVLDELMELHDYIPSMNAPVLVSHQMSKLMQESSTYAKSYPAEIYHKDELINDEVDTLNFEQYIDCVNGSDSELQYLDLGDGSKVPYRYSKLSLSHSSIPPTEHVLRVKYCPSLIVSDSFREEVEARNLKGCLFFDFEGTLL